MLRNLITCILLLGSFGAHAETVTTSLHGMTLTANLEHADGPYSTDTTTVLITHGTLGHNGMELVEALQEALTEAGFNSLAINLSLGIDHRKGRYACDTPHTHQHTDAVGEIGQWVNWLEEQGSNSVVLLGHSRGGNQTAWYTDATRPLPALIKAQVLLAPMTWNYARETAQYETRYGHSLAPLLAAAEQARSNNTPMMQPVDFLYCPQTQASPAAILSYYADEPRMHTPNLLTTPLPTLVIAGSADTTVPDVSSAMANVDNPQVTQVTIEDADHFFRDLYTYDIVDHLTALMESLQ
ncbi:alpha-beta hydrolase superfamily lysophospholipase [Marinobacterium halophilum]|uniref:Alpha-beta hydrolase superfamily lysophospholipase n=1 Tax=Marinobacterium halophilum TaxID=267374 RepID=A0A2P8EZE8_9GAMM|nr:alpha/beta fold hydrolase [Marinobacterium halophilum]PSL14841.1 alpha-beta hydrolase superfamily lysophospholipase [Marinobacterium halophilum]